MKCRFLAFVFLALMPVAAAAQVDRATLTGTVRDPSNAVVPKATVTATHLDSNVPSRAATTAEGNYFLSNLAPGQYLVESEAAGFQKLAQTVLLEVGQRGRLDFTLTVGSVDETVTVEGVTPLLDTESAVLGTVVDQQSIANLPLAIRNWDDLLALVSGVQGDRYTEEPGGTQSGRTGGVNVHGNRSLQNNFLLDGVDNNTISTNVQELSTQVSRPSIDAINEFKVVTSPYAAEYGRAPGAAISVTTKSGTNSIHGTAYDYFRNDRFDSTTFFAERAGQAKPENEQNQFGGNLGGPLYKSRAFFFADFEGTRISKGTTRLTRVATESQRAGLFTNTIRDPLTGQPFPGNQIPSNRIDPVSAALLALTPPPNTTTSGINNFFNQPTVEDDGERYLGRVDLRLSDSNNVFGRYIFANRSRFIPGFFGGIVDGTSTSAWGRQTIDSQGLVFGWNRVLGPSLVNEARFSWIRGVSEGTQDPFGQASPGAARVPGVPDNPLVSGGVIGVNFSAGGYARIGSPNFLPKFQHTDQFEYVDTLSWLRGNHQFKFGVDIMAPMKNEYLDVPAMRGEVTFNSSFTGDALADFLLGYAQAAQLSNVFLVNQSHWGTAFFVQDDWKATNRLTLNLGLRYDFMTPALEADNRVTNFDPTGQGSLVFGQDGSLEERALVEPDRNNLAPRIGVVYKLNDSTVLRGGYGLFYNLFDRIGSEDQIALNPPGLINNLLATSSNTTPVLLVQNGFPANFLDPASLNVANIRLRATDRQSPNTMIHQFSGGVEKQLGATFVVSADVIGAQGRNLAVLRNLNQPPGGSGPRPYPNFGAAIQWREFTTDSSYKGMDLAFEKRYSQGWSIRSAYTLSESIDQTPEHLSATSGAPQNGYDLESWEGPSDFDVRHRFVTSFIYELPLERMTSGVVQAIAEGWTFSGIYTARSGKPFTVTQSNNNVGEGMTGLPNRIGDGEGEKTVDNWFDRSAFQAVPSGTFGNSSRNILRGPGWITFDMSLQRRFALASRTGVIVRWDVFNLFNRANFGLPERNISSGTVGTITTLAGDPRIMQFALRVEF